MTNDEWRMTNSNSLQRCMLVVAAVALVGSASCARSLRNPFSSMGPPAPEVLVAGSSLDQIMAAVNSNAQKIQTYHTNNASITIPGSLGIPTLKGNIAAMRPGRIRLEARTGVTGSEVDLGSNDELFWFWVRRNEPPAVYFARHSQAAGSAAQQLMPIEPQWLLDALGLAEFRPGDRHEGPLPRDKNTVEITSIVQSQMGPITKRTVVDARRAWVVEQHLYDGAGTLLATAVARSHRYYPETGVSLPQVVDIRIPPAELAMTIDVGTVELNRLVDNPAMWALPVIQGAPAVDLGAAPPSMPGGGAPTLGSQLHNADWYDPAPTVGAPPLAYPVPAGAAPAVSTPIATGTPLPHVTAAPGPQFVPPGGVAAPAVDPFGPPPVIGAQRLPASGVPTQSLFTR
jgi:hypothetical protein